MPMSSAEVRRGVAVAGAKLPGCLPRNPVNSNGCPGTWTRLPAASRMLLTGSVLENFRALGVRTNS